MITRAALKSFEAVRASHDDGDIKLRGDSNIKKILTLTSVAEAAAGVLLIFVPSLIVRLLLGAELTGVSIPVARVAGIALISLGVGCFPANASRSGMLTYGILVTLYLLYLGIRGEWVGLLLWPTVVLHAILTTFLILAFISDRGTKFHESE